MLVGNNFRCYPYFYFFLPRDGWRIPGTEACPLAVEDLDQESETSSPDLHRGTPCWSVVAPRYCRRLVWRTLSSPGGRGTSRGSWFGSQDINWSDRLPYLLLTITYRHWNFFFFTNSLPPQWGTKQIAVALFLARHTKVEFYSYQCHLLWKKNFLRE